ncbi:MAG TPA: hypothetical protein VFZ91_11560 [Allosphingosinicella sp.]
MKRPTLLALIVAPLIAVPASAQTLTLAVGKPGSVYADPSDVVILLSVAGQCGSNFFHVKRSAANFREMSEVALAAFQTGKNLGLYVRGCQGDRNLVSHGYVTV